MSVIIDRRLNDRNKSAVNRERFIRRYKAHIQQAVSDMVAERSIRDMERGGRVDIRNRDITEPTFRHAPGGNREIVSPGNRHFDTGDRIARPRGGQGRGEAGDGGEGDGEDSFSFTLSREEFMQVFFDDLELPSLVRNAIGDVREHTMQRAGYIRQGAPSHLSVTRSLRNALGRRLALTAAPRRHLAQARAALEALSGTEVSDAQCDAIGPAKAALAEEIAALERRIARVPFLEDIDLRYRHRVRVPRPVSQAVMFCLMDVSASMDERKKDLAKRFFTLLYLFLTRKYERVDVVFIRHTDDAEEVDEERFFRDPKTGGTVVLSALQLMRTIIDDRYPADAWNIYGAQASDGDAFGADPEKSRGFLADRLLPLSRHFFYVETADRQSRPSTLSAAYRRIDAPNFAMREVVERRDIFPVFRELFSRKASA